MRAPTFEPTIAGAPLACPGCGSDRTLPFFEISDVPTNSCILLETRDEALRCPTGCIRLCYCEDCGFIANLAFDPALTEYSERYEETQGFSPTFSRYLRELSLHLIERFDLQGKRIVEIGCGKGEFLSLLCELAGAEGVGFDPAFREDRRPVSAGTSVRFVREFFSMTNSDVDADLYCNRMTLEHIPDVGRFLAMLRSAIGNRPHAWVYCQVPEFARILREGLFCDAPYEHCSYFSRESLEIAHQRAGFETVRSEIGYGGQHLGLYARPGARRSTEGLDLQGLRRLSLEFAGRCAERARGWVDFLERAAEAGERVVLWGSGSKSTAFLTSLRVHAGIDQVVDINPFRQGKFMAGTGQPIVAPEALVEAPLEHVIMMNPIYRDEISRTLARLGLAPRLHDLASV